MPNKKQMKKQNIKRTFIVDDDPFWTAILTQILTDLGYENIVTFSNGKDCIDNLHLNPSLVFLDYQMEDLDGLEVLKKIKNYFPGIGVVFCTAHEDLSVAVSAMKNGSFDYLLKSNASKKEVASIVHSMGEKQIFADKVF
jgi:DNA-binding NtrC family response regulator